MQGISIKKGIGVGDGLQFSSLPENYFRATGEKLVDVSRPWFFDHNPYVDRSREAPPNLVRELWNFNPNRYPWPRPRSGGTKAQVYLSNAEIWASVLSVPVVMHRPRLYRFEEFPFQDRNMIVLHTHGRSHGAMPPHVVAHVVAKYGPTGNLYHIGPPASPVINGVPKIETATLWEAAEVISKARIFIGVDSGPAWIACCYPDVVVKKVRTRPHVDVLRTWVPLEIDNIHAHWDDRCAQFFNCTADDIGFTSSYRNL